MGEVTIQEETVVVVVVAVVMSMQVFTEGSMGAAMETIWGLMIGPHTAFDLSNSFDQSYGMRKKENFQLLGNELCECKSIECSMI